MICENCGKEHNGNYGSGRFCCSECSHSFSRNSISNTMVDRKCVRCGNTVKVNCHHPKKHTYCDACKEQIQFEKNEYQRLNSQPTTQKLCSGKFCKLRNRPICDECVFKQICSNKSSISHKLTTLYKYFPNKIDNHRLFDYSYIKDVYYEIKCDIQHLIDSGLSCNEICKSLFGSYKLGNTIFSILQCDTRNLSESITNAFMTGKLNVVDAKSFFKKEWHTTWMGKEVYLRSSYEIKYAKYLDKERINYDVECLRIKYYDTQRQCYRCAIPDFYLPDTNTIVEIKSSWTLDEQNMRDKFKAYKELGYNCKCICDDNDINL